MHMLPAPPFSCGYWGSKLGPHAFTASTLQTEASPQLPKLPSLKLLIFSAPGFYITHYFWKLSLWCVRPSSLQSLQCHLSHSKTICHTTTRTFIFPFPGVAMEANRAWSKLIESSAVVQRWEKVDVRVGSRGRTTRFLVALVSLWQRFCCCFVMGPYLLLMSSKCWLVIQMIGYQFFRGEKGLVSFCLAQLYHPWDASVRVPCQVIMPVALWSSKYVIVYKNSHHSSFIWKIYVLAITLKNSHHSYIWHTMDTA